MHAFDRRTERRQQYRALHTCMHLHGKKREISSCHLQGSGTDMAECLCKCNDGSVTASLYRSFRGAAGQTVLAASSRRCGQTGHRLGT